jgi:hypothetical protein
LYHRSSQLAAAVVAGVGGPNFKSRLLTRRYRRRAATSGAFGQFIADEIPKWAKVIKLANIKLRSDRGGVPYFPLGEHSLPPTASGKSLSQCINRQSRNDACQERQLAGRHSIR